MKIRLALIYGSRTCEHDVSIISALQAAQHVNPDDYDLIYVYIDQNGEWYTGEKLADISLYRSFDKRAVVRVIPMGVEGKLRLMQHPDDKLLPIGRLRQIAEADVVMPVMHGMNGEDGHASGHAGIVEHPLHLLRVLGLRAGHGQDCHEAHVQGLRLPGAQGRVRGALRVEAQPRGRAEPP